MAKRRRTPKLKWKNIGFVPHGWDDSRAIKFGDPGFLYLCQVRRNDWRQLSGYSIKDLKWRPGDGGYNVAFDWTGLDEAMARAGANLDPPPVVIAVQPRKLSPEECEQLGRKSHRNWVAVRKQQRTQGQSVPDEELREWDQLSEDQKEVFRCSAQSLAVPEYLMWDAVAKMRQKMGEKAFRRKVFEISVSVAFQNMIPQWSEAERYRATDIIVKLSEMLDVPQPVSSPAA